jgi:Flp pilus assembly protein TadD/predicted regulator of Ras-like GTPase activity (Roadblock/LC7/MglB family)
MTAMKTPGQADIRRWSDDVARDPRSLAFLPLSRAYRRQGMRDAAMQLCLRGLEAYPSHVEGHGLLALLHLESGDRQRAADEWATVLRLDSDNFDALRGLGFCYLEQGQLTQARQLLERAILSRPTDATVQEALQVLGRRLESAGAVSAGAAPREQGVAASEEVAPAAAQGSQGSDLDAGSEPSPWSEGGLEAADDVATTGAGTGAETEAGTGSTPSEAQADARTGDRTEAPTGDRTTAQTGARTEAPASAGAEAHTGAQAGAPTAAQAGAQSSAQAGAQTGARIGDPTVTGAGSAGGSGEPDRSGPPRAAAGVAGGGPEALFDELLGSGALLGILLLDAQGLILAGRLADPSVGEAEVIGALLADAVGEARRTAAYLDLGTWHGILLDAATAVLYLSPTAANCMVVLAARRTAPTGWIRRAAIRAVDLANRYSEVYT